MDRKVLRYLADVAAVRQQSSNILGVARGLVDQKTLHRVSAKTGMLDKLFVQVLLSEEVPGEAGSPGASVIEDDYVDINQRLREAKADLARRGSSATQQVAEEESDEDDEDPAPEPPRTQRRTKKKVAPVQDERPEEEVDAFQKLLREAESQVQQKTATTKKKTSRRKKTAKKTTSKSDQ